MSAALKTQAQTEAAPINKGRFKKGYDARRHKFTRQECSDGFWAAIESVAILSRSQPKEGCGTEVVKAEIDRFIELL